MNIDPVFNFLKKHISRKRLIISVFILLVVGGIFVYTQRSRQKPIEYTEVKRADIISTVSASGVLGGKQTANLKFKSPGKLDYINVKAGDKVYAGEVLASLDTTEPSTALQQAQNNLRDKQATLDKTLDDIHLFQYGNGGFGNVGTPNETMTQMTTRTTAEVLKDNAYDSVKAAQEALNNAVIFAPFSGLVTKVEVVSGQTVSPTDLVTQVVDTSELYFDGEVDESDISRISMGQKANITLNAYPDKQFPGTISQIKPTTKTATSGATVVIVRIKLENPEIIFIADLNGQVEIEVSKATNILTIPQDALVDEKYVYTTDGKGFKKVEIKTGVSSDSDIEITEGVDESQKIVKNPANVPNK